MLISTHIVSDIEYIATRNAIMKAGKIVDIGTTDELVKEIEGKSDVFRTSRGFEQL